MSRRTQLVVAALSLTSILQASPSRGQSLPNWFALEAVVPLTTADAPVGFEFLPDGRVLLIELRTAIVSVSIPGSGVAVDIHTIADVETTGFEQGVQGIVLDSAWPARPYLYAYYNHVGSVNYLTMFTVSGDLTNPTSTNLTLSNPYHLLTDIPDVRAWHNGGTVRFGPDGMLYLSLGDDGTACDAQDKTVLAGAILRLDVSGMPGVGSGPPLKSAITPATGNPFPGPDANEKLVFAWGLRNPFRFTIDELTGDLFVADVGFNGFEEVDHLVAATPGGNYGWPQFEGLAPFSDFGACGSGNTFTDPIYVYEHDVLPLSVTGGPLYHPVPASSVSLPASYEGSYFFTDFYEGWIRRLVKSGPSWVLAPSVPGQPSALNWAEGIGFATDFQTGPDGALYLVRLAGPNRGLYRIVYSPPVSAPPVHATVVNVQVTASPNPATAATGVTVNYALPGARSASLRVMDVAGRVVRTLAGPGALSATGSVHWDGRDDSGRVLPAGVYFYRLETPQGDTAAGKISLTR